MTDKAPNPPAFPQDERWHDGIDVGTQRAGGATLLDLFAAVSLAVAKATRSSGFWDRVARSREAYDDAEAMLRERERRMRDE